MDNDVDSIMDVYGGKCRGKYIENPEQEFQRKAKAESKGLLEKYFTQTPQQPITEVAQQQTEQPQQQTMLTEKQQRNQILFEAANMVNKVMPLFDDVDDKVYINSIKEALEELMR